jgi:hypothetical protein
MRYLFRSSACAGDNKECKGWLARHWLFRQPTTILRAASASKLKKTEIFIAIALLRFKASWLLLCVGHPFTPRHMIVISGFPDRKPDEYHRVNLLE